MLEMELPIVHVNVSEVAAQSDRYQRLRAEIWYNCREWFERKDVTIAKDIVLLGKLVDELCSVEAKYTSLGKADIESKDVMRGRGVKSPNIADALCLTFAMGGATRLGSYQEGWGTKINTLSYLAPGVV